MFVLIITLVVLVNLCILIHYESLLRLSVVLKHARIQPRLRIVIGLIGALAAHLLEIVVFTFGYYVLGEVVHMGSLVSVTSEPVFLFADYLYFSFSTYTSLGFGDIVPLEGLRYVAGVEVLMGLVLIAWTASFIYVEMQRFWKV